MELAKFITKLGLKTLAGIVILDSMMVVGAGLFRAGELNAKMGYKPFGEEKKEAEVKIE